VAECHRVVAAAVAQHGRGPLGVDDRLPGAAGGRLGGERLDKDLLAFARYELGAEKPTERTRPTPDLEAHFRDH
jgi:hypothetical protein